MNETRNYNYPELLKLATYAVERQLHWQGGLAYPGLIEVYLEREHDFRGYDSKTKKGEMFICITTAERTRMTDILEFRIIDNIVHFNLNNSTIKYEAPLTPEFIAEVESKTIGITYWWATDSKGSKVNLTYLSEDELRNILKTILSNDVSVIAVKEAGNGYSRTGKLIDLKNDIL
jgi:hypothetical protein